MSDSAKHFKVMNIHAVFPGLITLCTLMLLLYVGAVFMEPNTKAVITGIVVLVLLIMFLVFIYFRSRAVVDYDGKIIKVRAVFRKYDIDLSKVSRIEYSLHSGLRRYSNYCIKMEFFYVDDDNQECGSDVIFDTTVRIDINRLIQGDHTNLPIMQMYDDIILNYPYMKAKFSDDSEHFI